MKTTTVRRTIKAALLVAMAGSVGWWAVLGSTVSDAFPAWAVPVMVGSFVWPLYMVAGQIGRLRFNRNSAELRDAPIGIGTITTVRPTGMTVNDRPQMEIGLTVRTGDGLTFYSVARELVALTELAALVPGAQLPVRYLPGRTEEVEVDRGHDQAAVQAVFNQINIHAGLTTPRMVHIATHGVAASAVVAAVRPTGRLVHGNPQMVLTLLVTRPDGTSFETVTDKVVAANLVGHLQVGRVVTVHYLPGDEHEVALSLQANPHV